MNRWLEGRRLVAAGLLAAALLGSPARQAEAAPKREATLIVSRNVPPSGETTLIVLVRAKGSPPTRPITLVDASGTASARIEVAPDDACRAADEIETLRTGYSGAKWCLAITRVSAGSTLSGKLPGARTDLAISVNPHHPFVWLPLVATIAGILVAIGFTWITTHGVAEGLRSTAQLRSSLRRNRRLGERRVVDLESWSSAMDGVVPDGVRSAAVQRAVRGAERTAPALRERLRARVRSSKLPPASPVRRAAAAESVRTSSTVEDYILPDGKPREHPAALRARLLDRADRLLVGIEGLDRQISRLTDVVARPLRSRSRELLLDVSTVAGEGIGECEEELHVLAWDVSEAARQLEADQLAAVTERAPLILDREPARSAPRAQRKGLAWLGAAAAIAVAVVVSGQLLQQDGEPSPPPTVSPTFSATVAPTTSASPGDSQTPSPTRTGGGAAAGGDEGGGPPILVVVAIAVALVTLILVVLRRRAPEAPDRERIPSTNPVAAFLGFLVASAWALLVAGVFATGVGWTTWVATPAFGTRGDYAALVLAVATSGSIAGIASAMLLVRRGAKSS